MFNKILVFGGFALAAILIVENLVVTNNAFLFIDRNSSAGILSIVSIIIGIGIGIGIKGLISQNSSSQDEDNFDF